MKLLELGGSCRRLFDLMIVEKISKIAKITATLAFENPKLFLFMKK